MAEAERKGKRAPGPWDRVPLVLKALHWLIVANFLAEMVYAAGQVFFVLAPEGHIGPLGALATTLSFEAMVTRRLYAVEFWLAATGLSLYLGMTEIVPRLGVGISLSPRRD